MGAVGSGLVELPYLVSVASSSAVDLDAVAASAGGVSLMLPDGAVEDVDRLADVLGFPPAPPERRGAAYRSRVGQTSLSGGEVQVRVSARIVHDQPRGGCCGECGCRS